MAATALATQITGIVSPSSPVQPSSFFMFKTGVRTHPATTSFKRFSLVRASQGEREDKAAFISQEDLKYLAQLGAGSVAGAADVM